MRYENIIFIVLLAVIAVGLLDGPIYALRSVAYNVMDFLTGWVDAIMLLLI